jgi:hypothetical protein
VLAVEQHRRLVLLALADHHDAVEVDRAEELAHRINGGTIGAELVALADEGHGANGGGLSGSNELHREVAVGVQEQGAGFGRQCRSFSPVEGRCASPWWGIRTSDRRESQPSEPR